MKKLMIVAVLAGVLGGTAWADSDLTTACRHALAGKCFHMGEVDLNTELISSRFEAREWCEFNPNPSFCNPFGECGDRVLVIAGILDGGDRNPCLPN